MNNIVLAGNPNSGKTTLFNRLTGSHQSVGNWSGVTVDCYEGTLTYNQKKYKVTDLPGIYSLSPQTIEQKIARDYIDRNPDSIVLNIVDAGALERNLYLTMQLLEKRLPMIIVLNMMDEVRKAGYDVNLKHFKEHIGVPVVPIIARTGEGIDELLSVIEQMAQNPVRSEPPKYFQYASEEDISLDKDQQFGNLPSLRYKYIEMIYHHCFEKHDHHGIHKRLKHKHMFTRPYPHKLWWTNGKAFEKDASASPSQDTENLTTSSEPQDNLEEISRIKAQRKLTQKIDDILTNKYLAFPIFLLIMLAIFTISFGTIGSFLGDKFDYLVNDTISPAVEGWLESQGASPWVIQLFVGGILGGLGSILVFIPQISIMFLLLSLLEDSGYMARAALISDRLLYKIGLGGKSFIPLLMGFGCSVPAIMACRALGSERDRKLTIMITPLMSCSARLPVYAVFAGAFFAKGQPIVIFSLYLLGILMAILSAFVLNKTVLKGESNPLMLELPPYRIPTFRNLMLSIWEKLRGFIIKAGIIIFVGSVIIWFLQSFSPTLHFVDDINESIFFAIGKLLSPIFAPLGFGDWRASVALLAGFGAKEAVVGTLGILFGLQEGASLNDKLPEIFNAASAYSFMVFTLLYTPCIAAVATIKKELNSLKWTIITVAYQLCLAWVSSFIIYNVLKYILN